MRTKIILYSFCFCVFKLYNAHLTPKFCTQKDFNSKIAYWRMQYFKHRTNNLFFEETTTRTNLETMQTGIIDNMFEWHRIQKQKILLAKAATDT